MNASLFLVYLLPLLFCLVLAMPYKLGEKTITRLSTLSLLLPALVSFYLIIEAFRSLSIPFEANVARFSVFGHVFPIIIWVDKFTIGMLTLTHILGLMVVKYSHGYLHLEKGYQRFFATILFFIFGMYLLCLAGTMDMFFAGWEVVGFSSFLLIAFYRSHTRSVQNAWRIYNIYRVCDVGLLMGAVMGHVLWHEATRFSVLQNLSASDFTGVNSLSMMVIALHLIFASLGKSAQFPFHNWPARAMEGPTPSSAIFYGALSIHAGVFLLIRTYPMWSHLLLAQIIVGLIGLTTLVLSTLQERVQPNIKGQIAFASTAQIGLMFVELSLGLTNLVMFHLITHALYRCFQLLVSPSIVFNSLGLNNKVLQARLAKRQTSPNETLYVLAMSDFDLDVSWRGFNFLPWKRLYHLSLKVLSFPALVVPLIALGVFLGQGQLNLPLTLVALSPYFAMRALIIQHSPLKALLDQGLSIVLIMTAIYVLDHHFIHPITSYMVSIGPALALALFIGFKFRKMDLRNFHGLGTTQTLWANLFMFAFLVLAGMPVSTAFIGEDEILEVLIHKSVVMAGLTTTCLTISGLVCVRIYTRLFMGRPV